MNASHNCAGTCTLPQDIVTVDRHGVLSILPKILPETLLEKLSPEMSSAGGIKLFRNLVSKCLFVRYKVFCHQSLVEICCLPISRSLHKVLCNFLYNVKNSYEFVETSRCL